MAITNMFFPKTALALVALSALAFAPSEAMSPARRLEKLANEIAARAAVKQGKSTSVRMTMSNSTSNGAHGLNDSTKLEPYRACLPSVPMSTTKMLDVVDYCGDCVTEQSCPPGCCSRIFDQSQQIVVCLQGTGCVRGFGENYVHMWTWESSDGFSPENPVCKPIHYEASMGQQCAVRFGVDDYGMLVVSPCPLGEWTGLLVPSTNESLVGAASCVYPPELFSMSTGNESVSLLPPMSTPIGPVEQTGEDDSQGALSQAPEPIDEDSQAFDGPEASPEVTPEVTPEMTPDTTPDADASPTAEESDGPM